MISRVFLLAKGRPSTRALGLVTRAELLAEGWTRWGLRRAVASGSIERLSARVFREYRAKSAEGRWLQELAALLMQAGEGAVVCGSAAAALHGLDGFDHLSRLCVQIPIRREKPAAVAQHLCRSRTPAVPVRIGAFPVTPVARTLADLGHGLEPRPRWIGDTSPIGAEDLIELALESALHNRRVTLAEVSVDASGAGRSAAQIRTVLGRRPPGAPPTESYLETRCVQIIRTWRLPPPDRQVNVHDLNGRFIGRIDLAIDGVLIECDGRETHDNPEAFVKDRDRWSRLQADGHRLLVLTYTHVEKEPARTCALIAQTIAQRVTNPAQAGATAP